MRVVALAALHGPGCVIARGVLAGMGLDDIPAVRDRRRLVTARAKVVVVGLVGRRRLGGPRRCWARGIVMAFGAGDRHILRILPVVRWINGKGMFSLGKHDEKKYGHGNNRRGPSQGRAAMF